MMLFLAGFVLTPSASVAQVKVTEFDWSTDTPEIIEMTVSPAPQTDPIFKHRLTFLPSETTAGNAATIYMHLFAGDFLKDCRHFEETFEEELHSWAAYGTPRDQIPLDKLREASARFDGYIKNYVARASRRRNCDWGYDLDELRGPIAIGILLDGLQDTRSVSRIIALQTKLAIFESRFDDAVDLMRMNYRLAENVGEVEAIVGNLIAIAETGITNNSMVDLIAAPDSPNMYWALTELPRPIVSVREALRMDIGLALRIFPEIASAETANHSRDEWSRIVRELPKTASVTLDHTRNNKNPSNYSGMDFISAGMGLLSYAPAKQRLIDSGMEAEKVEQMAVGQVLLIDANREYRRIADMFERGMYLPFEGSSERLRAMEDEMEKMQLRGLDSFGKILATMLLPALEQVSRAQIRVQRDIDALRVIEALRIHAADTGQLPISLNDVKAVFIPNNPATNKPFEYQLKNGVAVLELPRSDGVVYAKRYEISLR